MPAWRTFLLVAALGFSSGAYVLVLEEQVECRRELEHLCGNSTDQKALDACVDAHQDDTALMAKCGKRFLCAVEQIRHCGANTKSEEWYACLEKNQADLTEECPALKCEVEAHKVCKEDQSRSCIDAHKAELDSVCEGASSNEEAHIMVQIAHEFTDSRDKCRQDIHKTCGNLTDDKAFVNCLTQHEQDFETVCGKVIDCPIEEHRLCGFHKSEPEWMTCLEKHVTELENVCPQVQCEVEVFRHCNASKTREDFSKCVFDNREVLSKVCNGDADDEVNFEEDEYTTEEGDEFDHDDDNVWGDDGPEEDLFKGEDWEEDEEDAYGGDAQDGPGGDGQGDEHGDDHGDDHGDAEAETPEPSDFEEEIFGDLSEQEKEMPAPH